MRKCTVSVRFSPILYCTGTGVVLKPNLRPNVTPVWKPITPGYWEWKKARITKKPTRNIWQYNWLVEKVIKWYREIWNVDTLRKLLEVKSIKRAIFRHFFIWHFLTYLRTVLSIYWLKESYFTALQALSNVKCKNLNISFLTSEQKTLFICKNRTFTSNSHVLRDI